MQAYNLVALEKYPCCSIRMIVERTPCLSYPFGLYAMQSISTLIAAANPHTIVDRAGFASPKNSE